MTGAAAPGHELDGRVALVTGSSRGIGAAVAGAALYLASDAASWATGIALDVAGGSVLV